MRTNPWDSTATSIFWKFPFGMWIIAAMSKIAYRATVGLGLATGFFLRVYQIQGQIIADDEWHAIHTLLYNGYLSIATHLGIADYCIPLTLLDKVVAQTTGLTEMAMRLVPLLAGLATLFAIGYFGRRWMGRWPGALLLWLFAVSPLHIYFSRYARPYSPALLLYVCALFGFVLWFKEGRRDAWLAYVGAGALTVYFHLTFLPAVMTPLVLVWLRAWRERREPQPARLNRSALLARWPLLERIPRWVRLPFERTLVSVGCALVFVGPPILVDMRSLGGKVAKSPLPDWPEIWSAVSLFCGTSDVYLKLIMLALFLGGVAILVRRDWVLLVCLLAPPLVQAASLCLIHPFAGNASIVCARYCLSLLPALLWLVTVSTVELARQAHRKLRLGALPPVALCVALVAGGPLWNLYGGTNNWTNHALFQYSYSTKERSNYDSLLKRSAIPAFYHILAGLPPGPVVEAPWYYEWHNKIFPYYQRVHHHSMLVGFVSGVFGPWRIGETAVNDSRFRWRNSIHLLDHAGMRQRGISYVIMHKDLNREISLGADREPVDMTPWIRQYSAIYGAPCYEDDQLAVFDVRRVRR